MMWTAEIQIYVKIWSSQWYLQIKQLQSCPKEKIGDFNGVLTHGLRVRAAVL